jgi:predicted ABC-type ATPase
LKPRWHPSLTARQIPKWQALGYSVALIYLRLPNVDASLDRVRRRVAAGGHDIPEDVVARRFSRSLEYLEEHYKPVVDEWYVFDSFEGRFELAKAWNEP